MELDELRRQLIAGILAGPGQVAEPDAIWYLLKHLTAPYCYSHDPLSPDAHRQRFKIDTSATVVSFPVDLNTGRFIASMYRGQHTIKLTHVCPRETITASVLMVWPCWTPGLREDDGTLSRKPTPANETCYFVEAQVLKVEVIKIKFKALQMCVMGQGGAQFMLSKGQVIEITDDDIAEQIRHDLVRTGKVIEYGV